LRLLTEEVGFEPSAVLTVAEVLGPGKDFDALATALEDWGSMSSQGNTLV
jgi:hypothetical protein